MMHGSKESRSQELDVASQRREFINEPCVTAVCAFVLFRSLKRLIMKLLPFDYAVRNLGRSPTRLALSVAGSLLVVLLALGAAAFVRGMDKGLTSGGREHNVMLLGAGSEESVERSEIRGSVPELVRAAVPSVRERLGIAYISPEIHVQTTVRPEADDAGNPQVLVRGVTPSAFLVHEQARIIEGRLPNAGSDEILVGTLAARRIGVPEQRLAVGQTLFLYDRTWTISGRFEAPGSVMAAEVWMPLNDALVAAQRDTLSCVILTLAPGGEFDDVDAFARQRLDLELVAMTETDYYASLSSFFGPIRAMVWVTAILIASGGILGGLNTMYAAFAGRVREVGALQSLGFPRRAVVISLVQESVLASTAGALLAAGIGVLLLDGLTVQFSTGVFGLIVDLPVLAMGLSAGLMLGVVGAVPPAVRCLRLSIPEALKAA
jgi:putative ABC transport system permease protein